MGINDRSSWFVGVSGVVIKVLLFMCTLFIGQAWAAEMPVNCQLDVGSTGVIIEQSIDNGATWTVNTTAATCKQTLTVPNTGMVLIRFIAQFPPGNVPRTETGLWYNGDWSLGIPKNIETQ